MRKIYFYLVNVFFIYAPFIVVGQGAIINEVSNGLAGSEEFVELLVIGSTSNPTGTVDLSGWILDDNNGDFEGGGSGRGIAPGHFRIKSGCLTAVKPGSLIVFYNAPDVVLTPDETDSNGDCIYFFPDNSTCLEHCTTFPSTTNSSYGVGSCSYGPASWTTISLANSGDVTQLRDASFNFFHGFSYGDVTIPVQPSFSASFGGGPAFAISGSGSTSEFIYNDGDFTNVTNYSRQGAANQTPGLPNNVNNQYVINQIRKGVFDYSNLLTATNKGTAATLEPCPIAILPIELSRFIAQKNKQVVVLSWDVQLKNESFFYFEIERSNDGFSFEMMETIEGDLTQTTYQTIDQQPLSVSYYRLKIYKEDGTFSYSQIQVVSFLALDYTIQIFPNPVEDVLNINIKNGLEQESEILIYDMIGHLVLTTYLEPYTSNKTIEVSDLPKGTYVLLLKNQEQSLIRKFAK